LTTPSRIFAAGEAGPKIFADLQRLAGKTLVGLIEKLNPGAICSTDNFADRAISDGGRCGSEYLGYNDRSSVRLKLAAIKNQWL